jgi:hypothetical protein
MLEADSALVLVFANNLFIGQEPAKPANCVTIKDTYGMPPDLGLANQGYERPSIQIRVRNSKFLTGWTLIHDIKNLLHGLSHQTWNGTLYTVIYCSSGPALLDYDDNGNARFIINFNIQRRAV